MCSCCQFFCPFFVVVVVFLLLIERIVFLKGKDLRNEMKWFLNLNRAMSDCPSNVIGFLAHSPRVSLQGLLHNCASILLTLFSFVGGCRFNRPSLTAVNPVVRSLRPSQPSRIPPCVCPSPRNSPSRLRRSPNAPKSPDLGASPIIPFQRGQRVAHITLVRFRALLSLLDKLNGPCMTGRS